MSARSYYDPRDVSPPPRKASRVPPTTAPAAAPSVYSDDRGRDRAYDRDLDRASDRDRPRSARRDVRPRSRSRSRGRARSASRSRATRGPALAATALGAVAATALDKFVVERFEDKNRPPRSRSRSRSRSKSTVRRVVGAVAGGWAGHEAYKHFRDKSEERGRGGDGRRDQDRRAARPRPRSQDSYYDDRDRGRRGSVYDPRDDVYDRRASRAQDEVYAAAAASGAAGAAHGVRPPRERARSDHRGHVDQQRIKHHLADVAKSAWGVGRQFQASRGAGAAGGPVGPGGVPMNDEMARLAMKVAQGAYGIGKEYWATRQHGGGGGFHF